MERNYLLKTADYCIDNWVRSTFPRVKLSEEKPTPLHSQFPPERLNEILKYWNSQRRGIAIELEFEDPSDEIPKKYMDDGNLFFKHEKFLTAISHYSLALLMNCSSELKKKLLFNRSLAYFYTKNFEVDVNYLLKENTDWSFLSYAIELSFAYCGAVLWRYALQSSLISITSVGLSDEYANTGPEFKAQCYNTGPQYTKYSLKDTEEVLQMAPNYGDTKERKAKCLFNLERYEECVACLNDVLASKDNSELRKLKEDAEEKLKIKDNCTENGNKG